MLSAQDLQLFVPKMMVNELKNSNGPWQSTVPQQMPWMSSYEPSSLSLQFGQQSAPSVASIMPTTTLSSNHTLQEQHSYISSFPTTTTSSTPPITICPTAITPNTLFTQGMSVPYLNCVTTTTQSASVLQPTSVPLESQTIPVNSSYNNLNPFYNQVNSFDPTGSLTHIPYQQNPAKDCFSPQKRSSIEMEDDQIITDEPPTKQLLSEKKLFQQFGSLNIDGNIDSSINIDEYDSDDSDEDDRSQKIASNVSGREEFNRYVYLLFKDKKNDGVPFGTANDTLDRLAREERNKLSKAVILWSPPNKNNNIFGNLEQNDDDDDNEGDEDEEFQYADHTDFLRKPLRRNSSITITEVHDDDQCDNVTKKTYNSDPDEVMFDD